MIKSKLTILATHSLKHSWTTVHLSLKATTFGDHQDSRFKTIHQLFMSLFLLWVISLNLKIWTPSHLLVGLLVTCHLLCRGSSVFQHLENLTLNRSPFFLGTRTDLKLCLGVVLEVLAVAQDLASLDKGDRLSETFLLPHLRVLHPWLEHLSKISTEKK